jgi:Cupredoxin-like domain
METIMSKRAGILGLLVCLAFIPVAFAQQAANLTIRVQNHRFVPSEIMAPANTPIVLRVQNLDPAPMEFESVTLRVEKVVVGKGEGIIRIRPLSPGRYNFFDDFHQETNGVLVVR